jgi:inner membrane protein
VDNLAHALVGAVLGRAVADPRVPRAALLGAVAANAPDLMELFVGLPGDRSDYLLLHRGPTHSLAAALVETIALTLLVGLAARWWPRRGGVAPASPPPWGSLSLCIGVTVLSHLYLDWQGSYGLRPFLPWNPAWYYADWVAVVDPFFWLLPLIALAWGSERHWVPLAATLVVAGPMSFAVVGAWDADVVATWVLVVYAMLSVVAAVGWVRYWFGPVARRRAAALVLVVLGLYAGAQGIAAQAAKTAVRRAAEARFGPGAGWAALTRPGRPFTWEPMYASADTVAGDDWRMPRHLDAPAVQRALHATREGRAMAQFARFLAAEVDSSGDGVGATVYLRDARYARVGRDGWAVVSVRLGPGP